MTVGLTYEEAVLVGIGHLHPDSPDARKDAPAVSGPGRRGGRGKLALNDLGQNKSEARLHEHLADAKRAGSIRDFWWEPLKLRLAGNTSYRIDFLVQRSDGSLAALEFKGRMEDDAAVKLKVAVGGFPWLDFYLVYRDGGGWDVRPVTYSGISRAPDPGWWRPRNEGGDS